MHGRCVNYRIRRIKDKDNTISFSLVLVNIIYVRVANINICLPCICFLVCSKVFEARLWKSGPAKTGSAGPVPPPLFKIEKLLYYTVLIKMPYYSSIILNSFKNWLFPELFQHNRRMPTYALLIRFLQGWFSSK